MLIQQGSVQPFDKAVALWSPDLRGPVLDLFQLQEEFVRMVVGPTAKLPAIVREDGGDAGIMFFKEWQHIFVENMHGRYRQFRGVKPAPGVAGIAVDNRLQIHLADTLQGADKERIHGHQITRMPGFDMSLSKLRAETFQESDLIVGELERLLFDASFQAQ